MKTVRNDRGFPETMHERGDNLKTALIIITIAVVLGGAMWLRLHSINKHNESSNPPLTSTGTDPQSGTQ